ncbi:MAG: hypothetical protein HN348_35280 [Proteobacteria bacterium]|nr:hypothetical protein [Pseudomonadota bacterium]
MHTIDASRLTVALTRGLRESNETRFLQRLLLQESEYVEEEVEFDGEPVFEDEGLVPFLPWVKLTRLREFQLGYVGNDANTHVNGESVVGYIGSLKNLEVLALGALRVDTMELFSLQLPKLKKLLVYHVYKYHLETLAENPSFAGLEELGCRPRGLEPYEEEACIQLAGVEALVSSPHLKRLRYLELRASDIGDAGVKLLLDSGLVRGLEVLDLHYGEITDEGARLLAAHPDTKKLTKLDIGGNALTKEGLQLLADAGIAYVSGKQFQLDDEREYLWSSSGPLGLADRITYWLTRGTLGLSPARHRTR